MDFAFVPGPVQVDGLKEKLVAFEEEYRNISDNISDDIVDDGIQAKLDVVERQRSIEIQIESIKSLLSPGYPRSVIFHRRSLAIFYLL
ncbi:hypothetical protein M422DRAFT_774959, partial [Sphaerobolus stellatus SS14]